MLYKCSAPSGIWKTQYQRALQAFGLILSPESGVWSPFPAPTVLLPLPLMTMDQGNTKKISSGTWFRILFHILFWFYWLVVPFLNMRDDDRHRQDMIQMIPVMLTNIPLFFINTEILIPRILQKKGIGPYVISIILLALVFMAIQTGMKLYLLEDFGGPPLGKRLKFTFFFVAFVTAVSTGYGLVNYLSQQEEDRKQERQERLQSELAFLRSQISPHFIFNILNSIVYLIRSRSSELAESVTIKLSELMRYMLYESDSTQIPIGREIQYLTNYVELQKIRFEEDVQINFEVTSENESSLIEPMLMIPFVENAFKHGVGMIAEPEIFIRLHCSSNTLNFQVRNKTAGAVLQEDKDHSSGIGIKNVKRRLELLYPGAHTLNIKEEGDWYEVNLQLNYHAIHPVG